MGLKFFDKAKSFFGVGAQGSGGTRDAFTQYERYLGNIQPYLESYRNQLGGMQNEFIGDLRSPTAGLTSAFGGLQGGDLEGKLRQEAIQSLQGSRFAGVQAAKFANARGGMAFGGGSSAASALAGAAGGNALGSSLAQARLQAEVANRQFGLQRAQGMDQFGLQRAGMEQQAIGAQAQLREAAFGRQLEFMMQDLASRYGLAGGALGGGLAGDQSRQDRKIRHGEAISSMFSIGGKGG